MSTAVWATGHEREGANRSDRHEIHRRVPDAHDLEDDRKEVHAVTDGTVGKGYSRYHSREQGRDDACDDGHDHSETFTLAPIDGQLGGTDSWEELYM